MTHLLVLTPSLGRVSLGYRDTFAKLTLECFRRDIRISVSDETDPGHLVHARNVLLATAIDSDATHAFWWDADVSFEPAAVLDLVERPEAMICRPYPMRAIDWNAVADCVLEGTGGSDPLKGPAAYFKSAGQRWTMMLEYQDGKPIWSADRRLVRVSHCGFGWVLQKIRRSNDLLPSLEHFCFVFRADEKDWRDRRFIRAFDEAENEHRVTCGEDVSFCRRWLAHDAIWGAVDRHVQNGDQGGRFADYLNSYGLGPR